MSYYVPQMQQRYTGYDSGQNTARNLLDAVRMKNQAEMQRKQIASTEGMQTKQIEATDKLTSKELRTRYNIAKMGDTTKRDLAADSNQLARDLQSGRLDWQSLDREDKQMFEKTKKVLELVEEFKNQKINKNMIKGILKVQNLAKEIGS